MDIKKVADVSKKALYWKKEVETLSYQKAVLEQTIDTAKLEYNKAEKELKKLMNEVN